MLIRIVVEDSQGRKSSGRFRLDNDPGATGADARFARPVLNDQAALESMIDTRSSTAQFLSSST